VVPPGKTAQLEAIERLRPGLRIMALHALGDLEAAEEVAQETLVRALEAVANERVENPDNLAAFARGIARHVIADAQKAKRRRVPLELVPSDRDAGDGENPLGMLGSREEKARLHKALSQLSAEDREILHRCFFEGMTPGEIGCRLGEPPARIRKRKSRALARLRKAFLG
jgi:RNA polymerase sigma-70 factor (ECF subfamily)